MPLPSRLWTATVLLALGGCQSSNDSAPTTSAPAVHVYAYQCGELAVTGRFTSDKVTLAFSGRTLVLPQAMAASGARYADHLGNEFWGKGLKDATLTLAGEAPRTCHGPGEELPSSTNLP